MNPPLRLTDANIFSKSHTMGGLLKGIREKEIEKNENPW
jgi:hypothetical protein